MSASGSRRSSKNRPSTAKSGSKAVKSSQRRSQAGGRHKVLSCTFPGCPKTYKTQLGLDRHVAGKHQVRERVVPLVESAVEAVERALSKLDDDPKRAVLVAQVRLGAKALDQAEPTDWAKVSKELAARMAELMSEANPGDDDNDWTTRGGPAPLGDTPPAR